MQTEFYRSQTELLPTFSLMVAVSLAGLNSVTRCSADSAGNALGALQVPMTRYAHAYYGRPEEMAEQSAQIEAMRRFAEGLLKETEDTPQVIVEILNRHFWDLV